MTGRELALLEGLKTALSRALKVGALNVSLALVAGSWAQARPETRSAPPAEANEAQLHLGARLGSPFRACSFPGSQRPDHGKLAMGGPSIGKWHTETFIASPRCDDMIAP